METGDRIKQLRQQLAFSRLELARKSGVSLAQLNGIERSSKSNPTECTLRKICSVLGVTLSEFFSEDGQEPGLPPVLRRILNTARFLTMQQRKLLLEFMEDLFNESAIQELKRIKNKLTIENKVPSNVFDKTVCPLC